MKKFVFIFLIVFCLGIPCIAQNFGWEEVDQKWNDVFEVTNQLEVNLEDLELSLSVSEGLVNALTNDLDYLNKQWNLLTIRMQENDESYYKMYTDYNLIYEENEDLKEKNRTKTWWIVGGTAIGLGVGTIAGIIVASVFN